jgi:putative nucleotidyltransferase with HDIG domain
MQPSKPSKRRQPKREEALALYAGRWIALLGERVIGQGGTPEQALYAAQADRFKETPKIIYVPTPHPLAFIPLLDKVTEALPADVPAYLVGGAVRDTLRGHLAHDLDFILPGEALRIARSLAENLGAAYYPMDEEHDTARLLIKQPDGNRLTMDFAARRGPDLESDLRARDFTINAMAVDIRRPQELLDPLGGAADLKDKRIRACAPTTFTDDPLRILRALRQAAAFGFHILPETRTLMRQATQFLPHISPERLRDELFRILGGPKPGASLRALDLLGALEYVLPELCALKGVEQSPPHVSDAWAHTMNVLAKLESVLTALDPTYNPDQATNLTLGLAVLRLGRYRQQIGEHLGTPLNTDRSHRPLLYLAALYHDIAKPQTRQVDPQGQTHFYEHDQLGAKAMQARAQALHLSNPEIERLTLIVRHHMRPMLLAQAGKAPTRRVIYRFFRDTGPAGVEVCLLSLADFLATYGVAVSPDEWGTHLDVVRSLLEAWWERPAEVVSPPPLVRGHDLIAAFGIPPGPQIGRLLEAIREAQATGQVQSKDEALAFASELIQG